jgi:hypothetical protein
MSNMEGHVQLLVFMKSKQAEESVQKVTQEIRQAIATLVKTKWLVKGKGKKGKFHPRTGHEGPEGE